MKKTYLQLSIWILVLCFGSFLLISCGSSQNQQNEEDQEELTDLDEEEEEEAPQERASPTRTAEGKIGEAAIKITYGSPAVNNRVIFGDLVPYGQVWRTGANEATVFETSRDLEIQGKTLKAGKYSLFTIPDPGKMVFIFNKTWDQWGAYEYEEEEDVLRVDAETTENEVSDERMRFDVRENKINFTWDKTRASLDVKTK